MSRKRFALLLVIWCILMTAAGIAGPMVAQRYFHPNPNPGSEEL